MGSLILDIKNASVNQETTTRRVKDIVEDRQINKIIIPDYQRNFVWEEDKQCRFIESIFIKVPIPPIFLLEKFDHENGDTVYEIIDGVQRITTLENFCGVTSSDKNKEGYQGLRLKSLETLPELNNSRFQDFPTNVQNDFLDRSLNIILIKSDTKPEIQFEVFGRLNQGSVTLNSQELRNCMFHGEFNNFLKLECRELQEYSRLIEAFPKFKKPKPGKPDKARMLDVELILRFFALHELFDSEKNQYPEPRSETLNIYMRKYSDNLKKEKEGEYLTKEKKEHLFNLLIHCSKLAYDVFTNHNLNKNFFKKFSVKPNKEARFYSSLNQAVFDVQMLGFVDFDFDEINQNREIIYDAFLDLCSYDKDFIDSISRSTNHNINTRSTIWKNKIIDILDNKESYEKELIKKKRVFNETQSLNCSLSGLPIKTWEELDVFEDSVFHRAFSPRLNASPRETRTRETKSTPVRFMLSGHEYEYDNVKDTVSFILAFLKESIDIENEYDLNRLSSLTCVGTIHELSQRPQSTKKSNTFVSLNIDNEKGKSLYFDSSGGRKETLERLEEIASLFSSMSDLKFLD